MSGEACPACGEALEPADQTCHACGTPVPHAPDQAAVPCSLCGSEISAYTETCPSCGEQGYPALRPRRGRGWKGAGPGPR